MVIHTVLFKLKDFAGNRTRDQNIAIMKSNIEAMRENIKVVKKIEMGRHKEILPYPSYDVVINVEFASEEAYKNYDAHPLHAKARDFAASVSEQVAGITYTLPAE